MPWGHAGFLGACRWREGVSSGQRARQEARRKHHAAPCRVAGCALRRSDLPPPLWVRAQVKAWCYYESRLLGAHHGLISSYALETMVLYVLNVHHARLATPLQARAVRVLVGARVGVGGVEAVPCEEAGGLRGSGLRHPWRQEPRARQRRPPVACPQVLLAFLEEFSIFKWEEHCLSLQGPIPIRSFPNPTGERGASGSEHADI